MAASISDELDFLYGTVKVFEDELPFSAIKRHTIEEVRKWKDNGGVVIDESYFSGEFPSVYFKRVQDFQASNIKQIFDAHKKIWNQDKVIFLVVESDTEFRVVNCTDKPFNYTFDAKSIDDITLFKGKRNDSKAMQELLDVFGKISIETGSFWEKEKYSKQVKMGNKVEQTLVHNLKDTRQKLKKEGLPIPYIHNLLLRSLFILYLEDRRATDAEFYNEYLPGATSYFDILRNHSATYKLFKKLDNSFNGNLSPVTETEKAQVTVAHLEKIKQCFWSKIEQADQTRLFDDWRMFDFSVIPIQLISEIYEDFLRDEKGEEDMAAKGAFYTPHPLAEFVMNEVLPYPSESDTRYDLKILDPACGSGIFLVESLNRLLDRWQATHKRESLTFEIIKKITCDNIYGVEIEGEAIKVAAFSLYLTMLDRLDPKTLWQIEQFPYLIFDPEEKEKKKQGRNLFKMDTLTEGPFDKINFDLVVGNPPFGTKKLSDNVKKYLQERDFATEMVLAFFDRAVELCPNGKIALIATSKILFNNKSTYQNFRRFFFNNLYVDKVYNFSILRKMSLEQGRKYLPSASVPISIFFYSKNAPQNPSRKLFYCAPKTAIKNQIIDGIAIDPTDIKYLPREECQKPDTKIWKAAMWGTERDFELLVRLQTATTLEDFAKKNEWKKGVGFRLFSTKYKPVVDLEIKKIAFLDAGKVDRYYTSKEVTNSITDTLFKRHGKKSAYKKPHVVIKEGQQNNRFCASYLDYDCSFTDTIYGIHTPQEGKLKILTAFLNSKLAFYLMFLTAVDWGIERKRIKPNEILSLPALCYGLPENANEEIVVLINDIIRIKKEEFFDIDQQLAILEKKIETALLSALDLSDNENALIEDLLRFSLGAFQDKKESDAYHSCTTPEMELYGAYLCKTINEFLENSPAMSAWASVFELTHRSPLNILALRLNRNKEAGAIETLKGTEMQPLLKEIEVHTYKKHAESIYYRKFIRYYKGDIIYIVKPNEKRCWSRSLALNDADEIIAEILKG